MDRLSTDTIFRPSFSGLMTSNLIGGGLLDNGLIASGLMKQWPFDPVGWWLFGVVAFWAIPALLVLYTGMSTATGRKLLGFPTLRLLLSVLEFKT